MRECYNDHKDSNTTACEYANEIKERFSEEKMYAAFVEAMNVPTAASEQQEMLEFG